MTLGNFRLIRDAAQLRSISKAARANDLSQSAASQAIQELERELDLQLFDRSTRPLTLTPAGKLYADYCRDILRREEELNTALEGLKEEISGSVHVASIYSVGFSDMTEIEARFADRYPSATLHVNYLRPEKVWDSVLQNDADIGLVSYADSSREIIALPWREEEMVIAVSAEHPLAGERAISPSELAGQSFVGFDEDLPIQQHLARYLREHRAEVDVVLRFDNIENIKRAVIHNAGISIMPRRVLRDDIEAGRLVAIPLDPAELYRPVRIIHRRRKIMNRATLGLLALLQGQDSLRT